MNSGNREEYYLNYERLLDEAYCLNITVKELNLHGNKGKVNGNRIAIKKDIPTLREKACVLAEELGHYYTTVGNISNQDIVSNRKQELIARLIAYDKQIGLIGIIKSYESGCHNIYEMAEYLDVTEEFLLDAIECYRGKYGEYAKIDHYIIYFEPHLGVMKIL